MKVVFLDMDGVLNNRESMRRWTRPPDGTPRGEMINPSCVALLRAVVEEVGAKIVVTSSWRVGDPELLDVRRALAWAGWEEPPIIDATPDLSMPSDAAGLYVAVPRGVEIARWLDEHPDVTRYAILDDDSDMMPGQRDCFVQTKFEDGLTAERAEKLRDLLR